MVTMLLPSGCGLMRVLASAHERDVVDAIDVGHALLGNAEAIGEVGASLSAPPCLIARTKSLQSSPLSRGSLAMFSSVKKNWSRVLVPSAHPFAQLGRHEKLLWRQVAQHCRVRRRREKALRADVTERVTLRARHFRRRDQAIAQLCLLRTLRRRANL
jgi:hypothetical protein